MIQAVMIYPCGHTFNEDTVNQLLALNKLCPFDRRQIEGRAPNYTVRKLATAADAYSPEEESPSKEAETHFLKEVSTYKTSKDAYIDLLLKLLEEPMVQRHSTLSHKLEEYLEQLMSEEKKELTAKQRETYRWTQKLMIPQNIISTVVAKKLLEMLKKEDTEPTSTTLTPFPASVRSAFYADMRNRSISLKQVQRIPLLEFVKAIEQEPHHAILYLNAGRSLPKGGTIHLHDGRALTKQELYLHAISLDPNNAMAYNSLGVSLPAGGTIRLRDGTTMTDQELYLQAIALDPDNALAYINLGNILPAGGTVRLHDGRALTKQQLFLQAISLDPNNALAYINLGAALPARKTICLPNGTTMTKQELYLQAISLDPNNAWFYISLGVTLPDGETIRLLNGTTMTRQELYLQAIALDPNNALAYLNLGVTLPAGGTIRLRDGTMMTEQELYLQAIALDPNEAVAYRNLGEELPDGGSIRLNNGLLATKEWLINWPSKTDESL